MSDANLAAIRELLSQCSPEEQEILFKELRQRHLIHEFERVIDAPAEMILEAVHRAPELTRRMLRGVIADAAFRTFVVPAMAPLGWRDVTPEGNFAYDYLMEDAQGRISVQVKLQRSERGAPVGRERRGAFRLRGRCVHGRDTEDADRQRRPGENPPIPLRGI